MPSVSDVDNHSNLALQLLEEEREQELSDFLTELHPVELANLANAIEPSLVDDLLKRLTGLDQIAELVAYCSDNVRERLIKMLDDSRIAAIVRRLEIDDAADLVALLPRRKQVSILRRVSRSRARELTTLLAYDEATAGGIMTTLFVTFTPQLSADEALKTLRTNLHAEEVNPDTDITYVYVVDETSRLVGVCSLREILTAEPNTALRELMNDSIVSVSPDDHQEDVARLIANYDFSSIPVVAPENGALLGIITMDDVLDVLEEEYTEDLLKMAGTVDDDTVGASIGTAIRSRLPWLIASWLGGTCGALLLGGFQSTLEQIVALAFFMPVVFGMAGNVGSQASTITVRGLATGELSNQRTLTRVKKELFTGLTLGILFGLLLSSAAFILYGEKNLSGIVGCSIMITMTFAAFFGSVLPIAFKRLGVDPAVASGPLVTTTTDIISITIYFSVASLFLRYV